MRFRSVGASASNIEEYLSKLKEKENSFIEESTLAHIKIISLEEKNNYNDDYELLGHKATYKMNKFEKLRRNRKIKRLKLNKNFRKKIYFIHKRNRINSETINIKNSSIKLIDE